MRAAILNPNDPGLYRNVRGIRGDDPAMRPEGGQRLAITTGETQLPAATAGSSNARAAFDPNGVGLPMIVMAALLFVLHARVSVGAQAALGK